uniref:Uncharacterized protein n=1 Tax=Globodera rostochiensis TaxID=31243 RepID=A0A914I2G2_GLORO
MIKDLLPYGEAFFDYNVQEALEISCHRQAVKISVARRSRVSVLSKALLNNNKLKDAKAFRTTANSLPYDKKRANLWE